MMLLDSLVLKKRSLCIEPSALKVVCLIKGSLKSCLALNLPIGLTTSIFIRNALASAEIAVLSAGKQ